MSTTSPRILVVLSHTHNVTFFVPLAEMLEARGARVWFLSTDDSIERRVRRWGRLSPNVMHTHAVGRQPKAPVPGVSLEDVCRYVLGHPAFDIHYLTLFSQADRLLRAYGRHFDRIRPDLVMSWNGTIPRVRAAMKLAEARGIATLYFEQGNFPNTIVCDPKGVNYEGSMRDAGAPADFDRGRIDEFLRQLASRPRAPKPRTPASAAALVDAVLNFFARRSPFHPTLYFDHDKAVQPSRFLERLAGRLLFRLRHRRDPGQEKAALSRPFVFLPLQVHDDTQIIVHSPLVRTMEVLVDETVQALPEGFDLVVKSHPADEGRRGYRVIEELLEGPRCHFVHRADTLELVKRASCVVTVNSTVGLEALALAKAVVVLGEAVYAGRGITVDVHDLAEFPAKLAEAVTFRPDADAVKRFLDDYVFRYSWPGDFRRPEEGTLRPLVDYILGQAGTPPTAPAGAAAEPRREPEAPPLVSVVMPAYNTARFIGQAIRSVLDQTHARWELIIVDDGSTDDTPAVVGRFTDERIRYVRTENCGPGAARNLAIDHARGDFIAFLDSDDLWLPDDLAVHLDVFEKNPAVGLTYANVRRIDEHGRRLKTHRHSLGRVPNGSCLADILVRCGIMATSTVMLRREVLEKAGKLVTTLRAAQDWDLWWRVALHCEFRYVPRQLGVYRVRPGSISRQLELRAECNHRVIERAFSDPEVRGRFTPERLGRLRRRAEAVHLYNVGSLALRAGDPGRAAAAFLRSARTSLYDPRQLLMVLAALAAAVPFVDRAWLLSAVKK